MTKFIRLWAEIEVEIVDPIAARTLSFDFVQGEDGDVEMSSPGDDAHSIAAAAGQIVARALNERGEEGGFKVVSSTVQRRPQDGDVFPPFTLGAMPVRRDDGSFPDE